jgi:hypothetical protein
VLKYFEIYKYRQAIRKLIIELFISNGKMLEVFVKRERKRVKDIGKWNTSAQGILA